MDDILQAVLHLQASRPDTTALIVVEGQHRTQLQDTARAPGLGERVTFTGWVQSKNVPAHLAAGEVFVGSSRETNDGWVEAQGLTFIEAMVARTPVVASRVGGIVDSVEHERTGLLVDQRAPEQIARALERLLDELALQARLVDAVRRRPRDGAGPVLPRGLGPSLLRAVLAARSGALRKNP